MKIVVIRKYWLVRICLAVISVTVLILLLNYYEIIEVSMGVSTTDKVVVIDPGHGGFDPGKLGSNGRKHEKDINLGISLYLKAYLEQNGFVVLMTREKDVDLYKEDGSNRRMKTIDLTNRKQMVLEMKPDVFISIHTNSFQESKYYGAQTFYPKDNGEGMKLASILQQEFVNIIDPENKRVPLENDTVYIIKGLDIPTVLIECGFLSNPEEEQRLNDPQYQQKVAWSIYVGLEKYFKMFVRE